jgi:hypothetical protein
MKATLIKIAPPPPPPDGVNLEMTVREAQIMKALVGGILFGGGEVDEFTRAVWRALEAIPEVRASDETFSDLFAGNVRAR